MKVTALITEENCDKEVVVAYLERLRKRYSKGNRIYMVLDNAKYNRSNMVMEKAKESNITLIYLPPYSPNLNLIERLWKYFKKNVIENKYYACFDEFEQVIYNFFKNIHWRKEELKELLNLKFGIIKAI